MARMITCDIHPDVHNTFDEDGTYSIRVYNRNSKTSLNLDSCPDCFKTALLAKVAGDKVKWKVWDKESRKYVDAK